MNEKIIDHLFRHQFGKMVSVLTRIFGLEHIELIEDAVQDTFIKALKVWPNNAPENTEAWLMTAAKNRTLDLFRKYKSDSNKHIKFASGPASLNLSELFLDHEIDDSQLRMIFTACHPLLDNKEQIAFALKTIGGFSIPEIGTALMIKPETIKKRLQRSRKKIRQEHISFSIPIGKELNDRLQRVLEVMYLIFNEGFHSSKQEILVRKDLCGEAIRLVKLILKKPSLRQPDVYALFALMCFHSARLDSKINENNEIIDIRNQDRSQWYYPLIALGNEAMNKALAIDQNLSIYHYEAAIASEHLRAASFVATNWSIILEWYLKIYKSNPSSVALLNIAIVNLQLGKTETALETLQDIDVSQLAQRSYLFYGAFAEYYFIKKEYDLAIRDIDKALDHVQNNSEKEYLKNKKQQYIRNSLD